MPRSIDQAEPLKNIRRQIRLLPLIALIYFSASGGAYGFETAISSSGAGMTLILLIVVPLILSVPFALMTAELGAALPLEGGYYAWVKIALGPFIGFMEAMFSWLASWLDTALYPVIFVDYLALWFPGLRRGQHTVISLWNGGFSIDSHWLMAVLFMVPLAILNARGAKIVGNTMIAFMVAILTPFVVLIFLAAGHLLTTPGVHPLQPFTVPGTSATSSASAGLAIMIWSYIGYDSITTAGGEIKDPVRTFPKALLITVPLIAIGYILPVLASLISGLHANDVTLWENGDFALAGGLLGGPWLKNALVIGALLSQIGLFSSLLFCVSRIPMVLAADHYLPQSLARINPRTGAPVRSIILSCGIYAVFIALNFTTIIDADVILILFGLLLEFAALIALRLRFPDMKRPYTVPGGWFGAIGIAVFPTLLTLWLLNTSLTTEPIAFWIGVGLPALAACSYPALRRWVKGDRPDADLDLSEVDFGPGINPHEVVRGEWKP
ncbi:MAG: APC family permease [Actinobacteria bacterium]|nr:APC family permease [Actinomycetota bacterium]